MRIPSRFASVAFVCLVTARIAAADEPLAENYGFLPPEIYKLEKRIGSLSLRDLDGDGIGDVIVANNARSRIDLLLSGKRPGGAKATTDRPVTNGLANQVRSDQRMQLVSVPVNKEIVSLQPGDFNGDGKIDLAYYGQPAQLVVLYNQGNGAFREGQRVQVGEGIESGNALAVGDINGDGREDLAVLTSEEVVVVLQKPGGGLDEPERLPHTATNPSILQIVDLDGDGVRDLVLLDGVAEDPLRLRRGNADGRLGPEERLALDSPRAIAFANLDGKPGSEVLVIESKSGRAKVLTLAAAGQKEGSGEESRRGQLLVYPLPRVGSRGRSIAVGDLDGDKKADVVATDPANAQVLYFQQGKQGLGTARSAPSLAGAKAIRAADTNGDGKAEVLVLSESEKQIGVSELEEGRLTFPRALPTAAEPVTLDVGDLDGDGKAEVLYAVAAGRDGGQLTYAVRALKRVKAGEFVPFRWGTSEAVEVKGLNSAPPAIQVVDLNADGKSDLLVFNDYGTPVLLLGNGDGPPKPLTGSMGPLVNATASAVSPGRRISAGLLVAQSSYARAVGLGADGRWTIKDQFNAGRSDAVIVGAAALENANDAADGAPMIALVDRQAKAVRLLERRDGEYRAAEPLAIGPLSFQGLHVADFDGDGRDDLLLAGTDRFAVLLPNRVGPKLESLAAYETVREDAHLGDLLAGDANGDGRPDIVMTDTGEHFIEILAYQAKPRPELDRALSFQVYERKSFRDSDRRVEPRELALADVDGDKLADLVLLVHDRVLIYRQDAGPAEKPTASAR